MPPSSTLSNLMSALTGNSRRRQPSTSISSLSTRTNRTSTKENDGRVAQRRRTWVIRSVIFLCVFVVSFHLLWTYWLAGVFVPEYEIDKQTGRKKYRRHYDQLVKIDPHTNEKIPTDPFDGILEGYLTLIDIAIPREGLVQSEGGGDYTGVLGTFCHISWHLQQDNPSSVAMFRDLKDQSPLCAGTTVRQVDLWDISTKARQYDAARTTPAQNNNFTKPQKAGLHHQVVPPTAVVFHETRCGSTLVSNLLAASIPEKVRSYSESPPPLTALMSCDILQKQGRYCDPDSQQRLIQDVFYLMGRVTRPVKPQFVFYKIQSLGVRYIDLFTKAMPNVPWAFIYRDPVEIMMSHFKNFQRNQPLPDEGGGVGAKNQVDNLLGTPVCVRSYGQERQHAILQQVVTSVGRNITSLTKQEYCAAHLASLAQAAVSEYQRHPPESNYKRKSWFFNYKELPYVLWEQWLPRLHMGYIDATVKDRMQKAANLYSKQGNKRPKARTKKGLVVVGEEQNQIWKEDSTLKQARAPDSIKRAAKLFLNPIHEELARIEESQK